MRGPWRSAISSTRSCGARARNPGRVRSFCYPWRSIQCFRFQGGLLMVADAVSARARTSIPYAGRFFLTLFLLALYVFGQRLPLPGIDVEAMLSLQTGRNLWSVLSLGLTPLITGFILVELFSLLIPPGRRLRRLGAAGWAVLLLIVGLAVLVVRFFRTAEDAWLPAFPQGVLPVQVATAFSLLLWRWVAGSSGLWREVGSVADSFPLWTQELGQPLLALLLIPLLSWGTFHLFGGRPRLRANLTDPDELLDEIAAALQRRAVAATALLTLGTAAFLAWR